MLMSVRMYVSSLLQFRLFWCIERRWRAERGKYTFRMVGRCSSRMTTWSRIASRRQGPRTLHRLSPEACARSPETELRPDHHSQPCVHGSRSQAFHDLVKPQPSITQRSTTSTVLLPATTTRPSPRMNLPFTAVSCAYSLPQLILRRLRPLPQKNGDSSPRRHSH
ncbi:hypothetical protein SISSUDRAFT_442161 [Sistotremastrum suecicum HHB10207 ss-3]|uniref:Uncharacterized protein n=1 Tax=Sistotremastrum suecicum HHB10207 ss-3 TaxID=1314776 RepID=A0A165YDN4_9AGAM|nr:hypothetical protein SISSUDRAFT_442161 [Sistotremastrum suecicum HHB10207 ss-3]